MGTNSEISIGRMYSRGCGLIVILVFDPRTDGVKAKIGVKEPTATTNMPTTVLQSGFNRHDR